MVHILVICILISVLMIMIADKFMTKEDNKYYTIEHKNEWHDLRKNPKDLPKDHEEVLVVCFDDVFQDKYVCMYMKAYTEKNYDGTKTKYKTGFYLNDGGVIEELIEPDGWQYIQDMEY